MEELLLAGAALAVVGEPGPSHEIEPEVADAGAPCWDDVSPQPHSCVALSEFLSLVLCGNGS